MTDSDDSWELTPELQDYIDFWGWETYLSPKARHRLAFTRSICTSEESQAFTFAYATSITGPEFHDALREAGDDKVARAAVRAQHEID